MKKSHAVPGHFLTVLQEALGSICEEWFFQDERGYQGELLQELGRRLERGSLPGDPIIQQEYQKRLPLHKIRIRPDIIVHVPFERGLVEKRDQENFIAIELKRRATVRTARKAFRNLGQMKKVLNYPLTIFINVDSNETQAAVCPKGIAGQTVCFAVRLEDGRPLVRRENGSPRTRNGDR